MIVDIFIYLLSAFVWLITAIFSAINYAIPDQITDSIEWLASYLNYLGGLFPIGTLAAATGTILSVWILLYGIRISLWLWSLVPWVGKRSSM